MEKLFPKLRSDKGLASTIKREHSKSNNNQRKNGQNFKQTCYQRIYIRFHISTWKNALDFINENKKEN